MSELPPPSPEQGPRPPWRFVAWVERFPHWPMWQLLPLAVVAFIVLAWIVGNMR